MIVHHLDKPTLVGERILEHTKARLRKPAAYHERYPVDADHTSWKKTWPLYRPSPALPRDSERLHEVAQPVWPSMHECVQEKGRLLNPLGRTGLSGKGSLYHWGANPAADLILVRQNGTELEFLAIRRKKDNCLAIPGGFLDPGENPEEAARRELQEEAFFDSQESLSFLSTAPLQKIYGGYADDPRNTDHSWVEAIVFLLRVPKEKQHLLRPTCGPESTDIRWIPFSSPDVEFLYASHPHFIKCAQKQGALL